MVVGRLAVLDEEAEGVVADVAAREVVDRDGAVGVDYSGRAVEVVGALVYPSLAVGLVDVEGAVDVVGVGVVDEGGVVVEFCPAVLGWGDGDVRFGRVEVL